MLDRDPSLLETSIPGVFAVGDVRYGSVKRVASGVGEGSVAIQFVHQYLGGKGQLMIRTSRELNFVLVEIIDNGPGIPDAVKPHIFEPFFTTKGAGEGTGIGLDTVYRIVRAHQGEVSFDSEPGRTTFQVRLPLKSR